MENNLKILIKGSFFKFWFLGIGGEVVVFRIYSSWSFKEDGNCEIGVLGRGIGFW